MDKVVPIRLKDKVDNPKVSMAIKEVHKLELLLAVCPEWVVCQEWVEQEVLEECQVE